MINNNSNISFKKNVLKHIAIIMDGNSRWAKLNNKSKYFGYNKGAKLVTKIIDISIKFNVKILTLYAFSTENYKRPINEIFYLMNLFLKSLRNNIENINNKNIKLNIIGNKNKLNNKLKKYINESELITKNNTGLILNIAINYGGKWDIINCFNKILKKINNSKIKIKRIDEKLINDNISIGNYPDIDLVIRTGGEFRISNFILWKLSYSEFYFTKVLWPDFNKNEFLKALQNFFKRKRNFGKKK